MTENNNIRKREKIAKEIEKTSESIRKKHHALKIDGDITVKTRFKPIIEPLQKIIDFSMRAIKDEPELPDDDVKRLSVQKCEEDAKWSKRKRSNTSLDRKSKCLDALGLDASLNLHTIRNSRTIGNALQMRMFLKPRTTRSRCPFEISLLTNAGGSKNVARNVTKTFGFVESKVRRSYFNRQKRAIWTAFISTRME